MNEDVNLNMYAPPPTLNLLVLRVADPIRSKQIFEYFGTVFQQEQHGNGPVHYAGSLGHVLLELYPVRQAGPKPTGVRIGLSVDGLESSIPQLMEMGYEILKPYGDSAYGKVAIVSDFDGNVIELTDRETKVEGTT